MFNSRPKPVGLQPRFVLLRHEMEADGGRGDHWDLMLEENGTLLTFELERLPNGPGTVIAKRLADHRMAYLDLEGHVSGNRGHVIRLDRGRYHFVEPTKRVDSEYAFVYHLDGGRLKAEIGFNQPALLLPYGQPLCLSVKQWHIED